LHEKRERERERKKGRERERQDFPFIPEMSIDVNLSEIF
jgi:hypothetical protein